MKYLKWRQKLHKTIQLVMERQSFSRRKRIRELVKKRTAKLCAEVKQLRLELEEYKWKEFKRFENDFISKPTQSAHQPLRQDLAELELSHSQLQDIFAAQNDVVILYDTKMNVFKANPSFFIHYGFDPTGLHVKDIIRRVSSQWLDQRARPFMEQPTPRALRGEKVIGLRFKVQKADGSEGIVESSSGPVIIGEKIVGVVTVWHDITELKRAELELSSSNDSLERAKKESEERFRVLTEALPQLVWIIDTDGNFLYLNNQFQHYTGIHVDKLICQQWNEWIHPQDIQKRTECWREAFRTGNSYQVEYRIRRYDGEYHWFLGRGIPMRDEKGKITYWLGTCTDIHYQKELELELQETNARLHKLNQQTMTTLEEERRMISRELHDEAGQALTALKMYIELILKGLPPDANALRQRIGEAVDLSDKALKEIRRLAQDLRPPALDALGLNLTLEDFCYEFSKRVGLSIRYQGRELSAMSSVIRISLYRFLQEALTNIVKHAQASFVKVRLRYSHNRISLVVKDNGRGFVMAQIEIQGMGLVGMRERLTMLGGVLSIHSKPGRGTCLMATIPWEEV